MSDLFTDTVPTEPGLYWTRERSWGYVNVATLHRNGQWSGEDGDDWVDDVSGLVQFGPRVPTAEELAELTEKAAAFDLIMSEELAVDQTGDGYWIASVGSGPEVTRLFKTEAIMEAIKAVKR